MRHLPGQAARHLWRQTHRLLTLCLALSMLGAVGLGLLAWRLSQGPLDVAWLARRLEAVANNDGNTRLSIGGAALAWEGFRDGVDRPLDIRLRDIIAADANGATVFSLPMAEISLSLRGLLLGRFEPRAIELHNTHLHARRAEDGALTIELGGLGEGPAATETPPAPTTGPGMLNSLIEELARPASSDLGALRESRFSQLRRLHIADAVLTVEDHQLGANWQASRVDLDLRRRTGGGVDGTAEIALAMGPEQARLRLGIALDAGAQAGHATASLTPVAPAALAKLSPALAALSLLDAAVSLEARLDLGAALAVREGVLEARIAPGRLVLASGPVVLRQGLASFALTGQNAELRQLRLDISPREDGPLSVLTATGTMGWDGTALSGRGHVGLDQVNFSDLPVLWPARVSKNAREWITRNVTAGIARNAQVAVALTASPDFTQVRVTEVKGGLDAEDLAIHWLRPVPPMERVAARLTIDDPDVLEIATTGGRQLLDGTRGGFYGNMVSSTGKVRITGLAQKDQIAQINLDLAGPVAEVATLLRHPRLRLLDRSPFELRDPAGSLSARLAVTVPLEHNLTLDDITIHAQARTEGLRLVGIVAGRDLEQGALELDVTTDAMKITGRANVAAIPAQLNVDLDFRPGGPGQIQQRIGATARADIRQLLTAAGLDLAGMAIGPAAAQLAYTRRRDGGAELRINGELRETELSFAPLVWRKRPGQPAAMEARLRIQQNRITSIEDLQITGDALSLRGRMEQQEGRLALLRLERAVLGRTDARGTVTFQSNGRIAVVVEGQVVDLAPRLTAPPAPVTPRRDASPDRAWVLDAKFATAIMAHDVRASGFTLRAESDGSVMQRLRIDGQAGGGAMHLEIAPPASSGGGRRLTAAADDAATLLRGQDIAAKKLAGGRLSVEATYDDHAPDRPLIGIARIDDFRVLDAPAVTSLLQAMTFYGLLEMTRGPGLGITKLIAPFRMTDETLTLHDARAFNPSLGVTIEGRINRIQESCELNGTVVPAYFFNSLLGDLPLIGRLFAPESGGGLFAANYTVRGKLADPQVAVNPLSALTPGFLRGLFGNF